MCVTYFHSSYRTRFDGSAVWLDLVFKTFPRTKCNTRFICRSTFRSENCHVANADVVTSFTYICSNNNCRHTHIHSHITPDTYSPKSSISHARAHSSTKFSERLREKLTSNSSCRTFCVPVEKFSRVFLTPFIVTFTQKTQHTQQTFRC